MLKELKHRKSETDVMSAIMDACDPKKYMVYGEWSILSLEFPPPDMREGCEAFIADWE